MKTERIVFLDRASLPAQMRRPACAAEYIEYGQSTPQQLLERLQGATIAITNKVALRSALLAQLPQLRLIAIAATGYDCVDVDFCRAHAIAVCNVRNYAIHAVPEHAFALILALRRNLLRYQTLVRAGAWQRSEQFCCFDGEMRDLHGSRLVIVGRGTIGRATAQLARAFGMQVAFASVSGGARSRGDEGTLQELLPSADVLSLHCPLTTETRGLIGARELRAMKADAILINTARGGLVDEAALAQALREGWIAGAGFDVLSAEPPRAGNVLLELDQPNFILTPHVAWASTETMRRLADQLSDNIDAWVAGRARNLIE